MTETEKEIESTCPECDGTGQDRAMHPVRLGEKNEFRPCAKCGGSGKIKEAAN
ncbi:zinc finger domain-containing protein [Bradyrhizobium sp. STM 3566]|uniref:zinc finger domain-containing protein n=1 Tax=Bradyrhizobium sp. STM 3566 TaxID=578928 RepID=UPI00388F5206